MLLKITFYLIKIKFNQQKYNILFLLLFPCYSILVSAQSQEYTQFTNLTLSPEASLVNCFVQDNQGIIWFGSDKGLFSYNGYNVQSHFYTPFGTALVTHTKINCGIKVTDKHLYCGADNGILIFNTITDAFESNPIEFPTDIRTMALHDDKLWIGSLSGLYLYNFKKKQLENITLQKNSGIPHHTIYSILKSKNNSVYVGTYNGLCVLEKKPYNFRKIELPLPTAKNSLLINALFEDTVRKCVWIGTEGYLFRYYPDTKLVERINIFDGNSIKSLALDAVNMLLIGTDNGLYTFTPETNASTHIVHDSRNINSLTNNIIWGIFTDRNKNVWLGTDYGVSMFKTDRTYRYVPVSQITGNGDGNQLQTIFQDSKNNMWYGGTNGLILVAASSGKCSWYKMGDIGFPISHNRIRSIYEDKTHELWIATDGSINRYDYKKQQFNHYNIIDSTGSRNANWAYGLCEDNKGKLWIATCLGGIFVVDKDKLINSKTKTYVAEKNYFQHKNGLSDNYILKILIDLQANVWALTYNNKINKIDALTGKVTEFLLPADSKKLSNGSTYCMISDKEGYLWVGYLGGLLRIRTSTNEIKQIATDKFATNHIRLLVEENNNIWINSSNGTFVLNKQTLKIQYINIINNYFSGSYFDSKKNEIYFGGVDELVVFSPEIARRQALNPPIVLTGIFINDRLLQAGADYEGKCIRYATKLTFNYNQNNVVFEFSDLNFDENRNIKYIYKLNSIDTEWRTVKPNTNRIAYSNLPPGKYQLTIGNMNANDKVMPGFKSFELEILPPWYASVWAKIFYVLLIIGFIIWLINYFKDKHLLRIERIEKEKSIELSKLKIDFLTNVSHEFKTPLSLILAPVSKLLLESRNENTKKQLRLIHQNALRLNVLIQQVIGFERFDGLANSGLIPSNVEFVEFAQSIFSMYKNAFIEKKIHAEFVCNEANIFVRIDVLKMESLLNNLISNAYKYTRSHDKITLEISKNLQNLFIKIMDTGIGIPTDELPYIFERFYQSRNTKQIKDSSGIGLYLVRNYVELHGGTIHSESETGEGTTFTLSLPVIDHEIIDVNKVTMDNIGKRNILIIDDNHEVSGFLTETLKAKFNCRTAHNGKAGLEMAATFQPDLIIADVMMPVMDGLEFTRHIKKQKTLMHIPIIMLTAKDDKLTEEKSIELGVDAFMSKPFNVNLLVLRIQQLLLKKSNYEEKIRIENLSTPIAIEAESWEEKLLVDITRIIEEKVGDADLNVNTLSENSGYSNKQIYRKLKQLIDQTPVDYIRTIRMKKAAMLLAQQKFSVSEVMYLVGFSNASYFSKCFQHQFGKSPKQYMESAANAT